jgi:uncharacterized protein with ATP-grasp and redox domains
MKKIEEVTLSGQCMACMIRRQFESVRAFPSELEKSKHMQTVLNIVAQASLDEPAPVVNERLLKAYEERFGVAIDYGAQKRQYNGLMLEREPEIRRLIRENGDALGASLRFARAGNYIDFGTLDDVHPEKLLELLREALESDLDEEEYARMRDELASAKRLVYLTDNCGEVVLDKLFLEEIRAAYPQLEICVIVRGRQALNDATMEDAREVGLTDQFTVMGSGSGVAGTYLPDLSVEARAAIDGADLIISKGQGNFETLHGCGKNIYYIFLCKCPWFEHLFGMRQFEGVFRNERRLGRPMES